MTMDADAQQALNQKLYDTLASLPGDISTAEKVKAHYDHIIRVCNDLLDRGADVNYCNGVGYTVLMIAAGKRHLAPVTERMVAMGANIHAQTYGAQPSGAMESACLWRVLPVIDLFLQKDPSMVGIAAHYISNGDMLDLLVKYGFDPCGWRSGRGGTLLHMAGMQNYHDAVEPLLDADVDPTVKDNEGLYAWELMPKRELRYASELIRESVDTWPQRMAKIRERQMQELKKQITMGLPASEKIVTGAPRITPVRRKKTP